MLLITILKICISVHVTLVILTAGLTDSWLYRHFFQKKIYNVKNSLVIPTIIRDIGYNDILTILILKNYLR